MKLSTKTRYATTALLDIALNSVNGPVSITEIANRQHISKDYLEQLFRKLKRSGLVISQKGVEGGYVLGNNPDSITLKSIFSSVGEPTSPVNCIHDMTYCAQSSSCLTRSCWQELENQISDFLSAKVLSDLLPKNNGGVS